MRELGYQDKLAELKKDLKDFRVEFVFSDWKRIFVDGLIELSKIFRGDLKFIESEQKIFVTFQAKKEILAQILNVLRILTPN